MGNNERTSGNVSSCGGKSKHGIQMSSIEQLINTAISDQVSALFSVGITDEEAASCLWSVADSTSDWARQRLPLGGAPGRDDTCCSLEWSGMDSWEEMVWCPALGIKGQVDMILKEEGGRALPVELKTGKWRPNGLIGHRAQVHSHCRLFLWPEPESCGNKLRVMCLFCLCYRPCCMC